MTAWVARIAPARLPVLIEGESGSGKELVAAMLHRLGARAELPFVAVNCAALPESLLEAELFGASRGAYTGAERERQGLFRRAHGGTLFLDEVGDMPAPMQAKLLRVLETGRLLPVGGEQELPADVRLIAATHRDLDACVTDGSFRADLLWRLGVLRVELPPLRERLEDLPALVADLRPRLERETGCRFDGLTDRALERLRRHDWPGNVRELHGTLARALLRAEAGRIDLPQLGLPDAVPTAPGGLERGMIQDALLSSGGSIVAAAERIGWTRQKLYRRMAVHGIPKGGQECFGGTSSSDSSTFQ